MSKLNGMQIFELLSNVNDDLIAESVAPDLLAGGATAAAAGATAGAKASSAGAATVAAKTGFAAWLAKGGWAIFLAAAVVTVAVNVGGFLWLESVLDDFSWPDLPSLIETRPTDTAETSEPDGTQPPAEEETEAVTERETAPPLYVDDFEPDAILSLFSAEQGTVSLEDGDLVVEAEWGEGDENFSTLCFDPRAVMRALGETDPDSRGALLLKIRRENALIAPPTVHPGTEILGHDPDVTIPVYPYRYYLSDYEYIVVELDAAALYKWRESPLICVEWLGMEGSEFDSEGRRMTVSEISFYRDIWDAFFSVEEKLAEDGVSHPSVKYTEDGKNFKVNRVTVPFFYLKPKGPTGDPIRWVLGECFTNSISMRVAVFHEGFEYISGRAMISSELLQAVYLPDSLTKLESDPFHNCPELTRVRLGSGIEFIDDGAFHYTVTDIDYNGTMAQWCQVDRRGSRYSRVTVHCLDGDLPYHATEPDPEQAEARREAAAWGTPLALAEGQVAVGMESVYVTLSHPMAGERTVLLRWALTRRQGHLSEGYQAGGVFYFDVMDPENGEILYLFDREESLSYTREEGSSLFFIQSVPDATGPRTATLFLTNYGYSDDKSTFTARTTHFRLELTESGEVTVNREVSDKLKDEVTIACPVEKTAELARLRQVFMDIHEYMGETYDLSNLRPARLLLVTRPHGDSAFFSHRLAPVLDGFVLAEQETFLDVANFNFQTLEYLYERFGVYDVLE